MWQSENEISHDQWVYLNPGSLISLIREKEMEIMIEALTELLRRPPEEEDWKKVTIHKFVPTEEKFYSDYYISYENKSIGKMEFVYEDNRLQGRHVIKILFRPINMLNEEFTSVKFDPITKKLS